MNAFQVKTDFYMFSQATLPKLDIWKQYVISLYILFFYYVYFDFELNCKLIKSSMLSASVPLSLEKGLLYSDSLSAQ